jgi:hypothetical protein
MTLHQVQRAAVPVVSALVGVSGLWFGVADLVGYPGRLTIAGALSIAVALVTLALVSWRIARKQLHGTWRKWSLFILIAAAGYLVAMDGFSYVLYLRRPGGLPGGCYTLLEIWARVPRGSWIRDAEQIAAVLVFFGSPLALLAERPGPKRGFAINGA